MRRILQRIRLISTNSNLFSSFLTRISRSQAFQVYFIVKCSPIPNLAAGHRQALQDKPSRQVAVFCAQLGLGLIYNDILMQMLCHDRRYADHRFPGIPAVDRPSLDPLDRPSTGWPSWPSLYRLTLCPPHPSLGCHTLHLTLLLLTAFIQRYSLLSSRLAALMSHVILNEWQYLFYSPFFNIHLSGVLKALFGCSMADATWNCCCLVASSVYTIQPCTSWQCYFQQSH